MKPLRHPFIGSQISAALSERLELYIKSAIRAAPLGCGASAAPRRRRLQRGFADQYCGAPWPEASEPDEPEPAGMAVVGATGAAALR